MPKGDYRLYIYGPGILEKPTVTKYYKHNCLTAAEDMAELLSKKYIRQVIITVYTGKYKSEIIKIVDKRKI